VAIIWIIPKVLGSIASMPAMIFGKIAIIMLLDIMCAKKAMNGSIPTNLNMMGLMTIHSLQALRLMT
jgi:hypothetical protein